MSIEQWPTFRLDAASIHEWPRNTLAGRLVVLEGVDGSGRATQLDLLTVWLQSQGFGVVRTAWNSSKLVARTIAEARKQQTLTPLTYSILHATDVAERQQSEVLPALEAGYVVLADRYVFTALARDIARGVSRDWMLNLYSFALRPDLAIYLRIPADESMRRTMGIAGEATRQEAVESASVRGTIASFRAFQERVNDEYEQLVEPFGLHPLDATLPIRSQQLLLRRKVAEMLDVEVTG